MGAYITNLPSTPQMARYTAAPSSYTDPTVKQSVEPWWGSSVGGCAGCGGLGATNPFMDRRLILAAAGAAVGYLVAPKAKRGLYVIGGLAGGLLLAQAGLLIF